jgi:hypothetical protein
MHPDIQDIYTASFSLPHRPPEITRRIHLLKEHFKQHLYGFVDRFNIRLLVVENALTIPLNIPLGLALTEYIAETGIHTIAHHHDFFWERQRFSPMCVII